MRLKLLAVLALLAPITTFGQYQPWAVQWLQHASTAQNGREYMGIFGTSGTNSVYAQFSTNWLGSNAMWLSLSSGLTNYTPGSNVTFTLTSPYNYQISASGGGGATTGLSVTQTLLLVSVGLTNLYTNAFVDGLLVASGPAGASHLSSILLPGGGYLLQPGGGTILLP